MAIALDRVNERPTKVGRNLKHLVMVRKSSVTDQSEKFLTQTFESVVVMAVGPSKPKRGADKTWMMAPVVGSLSVTDLPLEPRYAGPSRSTIGET